MGSNHRYRLRDILVLGVVSTVVMDLGFVFLKLTRLVQGSMEPQFLGRWVLHMLDGELVQADIASAASMPLEKPVSLALHYLVGMVLAGLFLSLRRESRPLSGPIWKGVLFGWVTVLLPWFVMYPALGFGFLGLETPEGAGNILYGAIYHSFYGLGITLWLGLRGASRSRASSRNLVTPDTETGSIPTT